MSPVKAFQLGSGLWQPLDGVGGPIAPGAGNEPPDPGDQTDFRARALMVPPVGKVAFGFSPTFGTLAQLETLWGRTSRLVRLYGGTMTNLAGFMSTAQNHLNAGRVPVLDFNTSAQYAGAGFDVTNVAGTGKSLWRAQADGYFDASQTAGSSFTGQAYAGLDEQLLAVKALTQGSCPTNRVFLSKDHEMEDMNEGGGDGKVNGAAVNKSSGSVADFRAAWQHTRQRATVLGALNIVWFMDGAAGVTRWGESMTDTGSDGFYPGHSYVDAVAWDPYNAAGLRGTTWAEFPNILNKFGQLDWWNRNFKVGGKPTLAQVTGTEGVYKPAMLAEFGTVDLYGAFTAINWAQGMRDYMAVAANSARFRWLVYYNNSNMTILNNPSNRRTSFANMGADPVWA